MKKEYIISGILLFFLTLNLFSQDSANIRKWSFKGYLNDIQTVMFTKVTDPWVFDNEIHNRLDLDLYPFSPVRFTIGMRNRFVFGQSITQLPGYKGLLTYDAGMANLTWSVFSGQSYVLVSELDRLMASLTLGKFQVTIGRQRVNWAQTIVWNPNDIFNTYNYFDFDYPERPGNDAARIQYYPSTTSDLEACVKWNNQGKITVAALGRFNIHGYDIQFLSGLLNDQDFVVGMGWSGNLWKAAFRGELTYFQPKMNCRDTTGILSATIGLDYIFTNSISVTFQAFYNQLPPGYDPASFIAIYIPPVSAKTLSFTTWNIMGQVQYPFTPLFEGALAVIYYPELNGYYIGPNLNYSVRQNFDLSIFVQYFTGTFKNSGPDGNLKVPFKNCLSSFRLKWNF